MKCPKCHHTFSSSSESAKELRSHVKPENNRRSKEHYQAMARKSAIARNANKDRQPPIP